MVRSSTGDTQAFTELYDRYQGKMCTYFFRMLWQDREKANDMTQDLFSKLIEKPELYKQGKKFSTWIYAIAGNMCKNEYRRHAVRVDHAPEVKQLYSSTVAADEKGVDRSNFKTELSRQLAGLSEEQRHVFILRFKQDMSIKEIAEIMECSEGTVKSRIFYTLKKLSKGLEVFDPNYEK